MALTSEDLLAISQLVEVKLTAYGSRLESALESKLESVLESKLESALESRLSVLESKLESALESKLESALESKLESVLESKLKPIRDDIHMLKLQNENDILPRLQNIEDCYLSTYKRYREGIMQLDAMQADIDIMKNVLVKHSEQLQQLA